MDLEFTKEDEDFRLEVRDFISKNFPQKLRDIDKRTDLTRDDILSWHKVLYKKGWSGINIDINKISIDLFKLARPNDINLNLAISDANKKIKVYQTWNDL